MLVILFIRFVIPIFSCRYFETFDMLSGSSFKEHTSWNERFAQCKSEEEVGGYFF